jgi:sec-independent protein translocase protein TatB
MGLENLNGWEIVVIVLVGLFIFGPDKLPKMISDGMRMIRTVRDMARNATSDLSRELGTQVELEDLHPKTFLRKHLLSEADEAAIRKPLQDIYSDVQGVTDSFRGAFDDHDDLGKGDLTQASEISGTGNGVRDTPVTGRSQQFDDDAT